MASTKIKHLFNGRFFQIPKYQRGFAWEQRNIGDLFDDINESIETRSDHYIGTVVLSQNPSKEDNYYIVDGQQRITTIILIINEIVKYLPKGDKEFYHRFYIAETSDNGKIFRLTTLGKDNDYFTNLLVGNINEPQNKSQKLLKQAFEQIQSTIEDIADKREFLKSIENLEIMEFIEKSEGDAIRIFQTVNDRGKPLSNMEKAKSLMIYFSNRYLQKKLDDKINDLFGEIFEIYDEIKHIGETQSINLIRKKDFDEDNIMRFHFVSYSDENYDATADYVLGYLKKKLTSYRNKRGKEGLNQMEVFINKYITNLHDFFNSLKEILYRTFTNTKYFKIFSLLDLSATLYPIIVKLEMLGKLDAKLPNEDLIDYTFLDLIEIIDVRIYKTRGTDPRAEISRFATELNIKWTSKQIQDWLLWYNKRWMPREEFSSKVNGHIYGNRALVNIFINYCESLERKEYNINELKKIADEEPTIEHILSKIPKFSFKATGFKDEVDFLDYQDTLGNLTALEKRLNSAAYNKVPVDKVEYYKKSFLKMTRIASSKIRQRGDFIKRDIKERQLKLSDFIMQRWWC